jgi:predicted ATPase/class 3 adenylate cyclase
MDVSTWLRGLGLENYAQAFRANDIDAEVLLQLTAEDLVALGVTSVGHRRKLLHAITTLHGATAPARAEPIAAAARPIEAERRQLTVLFCDLVGSTELAARLDPEDLRGIMGAYQRCAAAVVERFEGHIAKYLGDGVLAYFGWPRAHEDDAERAVRVGLVLVEEIERLEPHAAVRLQARIGIATGLVVVGDLIGAAEAQERAVVGETPSLAARLQALAAPGGVVISAATRRLIGGLFQLEDLGPQRLKGFAEPLAAWRISGESPAEGRFEARQSAGLTLLVDREEEIALLLRRWRQAIEGEGQVILLSGEPGIGKSRVVREVRARLKNEPHIRLLYQCSPHHVTSPLHPVIEQMERAAGFARGDPPEARLEKLEALLARGTDQLDQAVPLIGALLGITTGEHYALPDLTPQRQKQRTFEVLVDQLEGLAAAEPALVTYEDVQWIDPTTEELLSLAIERIEHLPVLLLITFRPEFTPPWAAQPHVSALALTRLDRRDGAAMVGRVVGDKALPAEVAAQIVSKTDGVPLFVEELTKTVLESGLLADAGDHWELAGPLTALALPSTLQDSLMARLDRLAPVKEVAQVAACLGREFPHQLLAAVVPLPQAELTPALDRLVEAELLFRRGDPPDASYTFKHALVRDAAYASLLKSRRRQYHGRIARVLEDRFPETAETQPELLAQHFAEAGLIDEAIEYWRDASQRAIAQSAMEEAATQAAKGLELLQSLAPDPGRPQRELNLQLALASALNATKGHGTPEVRETYARAVEVAKQLEDTAQLFPALDGLITCHFSRAELATADKLAEEFLDLAERTEDIAPQLVALSEVGIVRLARGDLLSARRNLERALALYDPIPHASLRLTYSFDPRVICLGYLSWTLFSLGYPAQALRFSQQSIVEARRCNHPMTLGFALTRSAALLQLCREWQTLETTARELMALALERGFRNYRVVGRFYEEWTQVHSGRSDSGPALLQEVLVELRAGGDEDWFPHSLSLLAEAHHRAGQTREGLELLEEALDRVDRNEERWFAAEVHRLRGELLLFGLSQPTLAEECFLQATRAAQEQHARMWELRAATSLARLWRDQMKHAEAHDLLAPIYGWFTEGFDSADLKEAKALLDELG